MSSDWILTGCEVWTYAWACHPGCIMCVCNRYHNIGVLLFTLHDINDVILEGCKCLLYVKVRGGKEYPIWENVANVGFAIFCVTW